MKKVFAAVLTIGTVVVATAAAHMGGWAVVSVESPPEYIVAGKPVELTFVVRQHAVTPRSDLTPAIEARSAGQRVKGMTWTRRDGSYGARITVPTTGEWQIMIQSGWGRSRGTLIPIEAIDSTSRAPAPLAQPERGRRLFAAKGCVTCHVHGDVAIEGELQSFGPELTGRRFPPDYLARFLADPSIKPPVNGRNQMPNPQLKQPEIAAIVAFINGERRVANR